MAAGPPAAPGIRAAAVRVDNRAGTGDNQPRRLYWGAWIGSQLVGQEAPWDMNAVHAFETIAGKGLSLVNFSSPFVDCTSTSGSCAPLVFARSAFENIRRHGAIPFFSWNSASLPVRVNQPDYQLRDVTAGAFDGYIRDWAIAAKSWGHPFFLRFDWEMNAAWFPWAERANGNQRGDYVKAWRHVHDIFASVGATNATWVWCPFVDPRHKMTPLKELYPGDTYVDWTCLDGYNLGKPWRSFDQLFRSTYQRLIRIAPTKPVVIGEVASSERGGSKSGWIANLLTKQLPDRYRRVGAVVWFDKFASGDWPIETSSAASAAFAKGVASPVYVPNQFDSIGGGVIGPLG